jgi:hypothetical protein
LESLLDECTVIGNANPGRRHFVSAFTFGTGVAGTVGKGFVDHNLLTPKVILAGLIGVDHNDGRPVVRLRHPWHLRRG